MSEERQPPRPGRMPIPLDDRAALLALRDFKRESAGSERLADDRASGASAGNQAA